MGKSEIKRKDKWRATEKLVKSKKWNAAVAFLCARVILFPKNDG